MFVKHGLRFTEARSDTRCCPARASYLTGLWITHHHVYENNAAQFRPEESLATALNRAGYHTMLAGKYLNGYGY